VKSAYAIRRRSFFVLGVFSVRRTISRVTANENWLVRFRKYRTASIYARVFTTRGVDRPWKFNFDRTANGLQRAPRIRTVPNRLTSRARYAYKKYTVRGGTV